MNHIYKTVWNSKLGTWTAAQETAKSHGKSASVDGGVVASCTQVGTRFVYTLAASAVLLMSGQAMAVTGTEYQIFSDNICFYDTTTQSVVCGDATTSVTNTTNGNSPKSVVMGKGATSDGETNVAIGANSVTKMAGAIAIGGAAKALDNQAIAIGTDTHAGGESALAIGKGAQATAKNAISIGVGNVVSGANSGALGNRSYITGSGTYTIGNDNGTAADPIAAKNAGAFGNLNRMTAAAENSRVVGNYNHITTANTYVLGSGINSTTTGASLGDTVANSVYLGNDSQATGGAAATPGTLFNTDVLNQTGTTTSAGAEGTVGSAIVGGITYGSFAGQKAVGAVTVGAAGSERRIQNVAAGEIAATSTDAINGSQLHATQTAIGNLASSTAAHLGGGAAVQANGSISAPTYTINGNTYNNVGAALAGVATHYYSVNSTNQAADSNYTNNGATGQNALAAGVKASAAGTDAVAVGSDATASGAQSLAVGNNVQATHLGATAVGNNSRATADSAQAFGQSSQASAKDAVAVGRYARAQGERASAFGVGNLASGASAVSVGDSSQATRAGSIAIGSPYTENGVTYASKAWSDNAIAIGSGAEAGLDKNAPTNTNAGKTGAIAIGTKALAYEVSAVAMGEKSGAFGVNSLALGANATSNNNSGVAIGDSATSNAVNALAIGTNTKAEHTSAVAIGDGAHANNAAYASVALGNNAKTQASQSLAAGFGAEVTVSDAVALGSSAVANRAALTPSAATSSSASAAANTVYASDAATAADKAAISATVKGALGAVSVGSGTATRQIINVAAGSEDTDAVNVAQLKAVAAKTATTPLVVADGTGNDPVGKVIAPATADAGKLATAGDIANAINKAGFTLTAVAGTGGELGTGSISNELINAGDTVTVEAGKNIKVTQINGTINVATKDSVAFTSVTTGGTVMDGSGVTIAAPTPTNPSNTVSLTASGLDNGGNKITNVADGASPNDAVNFSQLSAVRATAEKGWDIGNGAVVVNTVTPGKKVDFVSGNSSNTRVTVGKDAVTGNSIVTVSAAPDVLQYTNTNNAAGGNTPTGNQFTPTNQVTLVGAAGSTGGVTINNVAPAELSASSKQAVNGSQLYAVGSSTAAALGGSSAFNPSTGQVTAGLNVGGTTYNNVQSALNAINTTAGSGWNLQANGGPASNIAPNGTVNVVNGSNTAVTLTGNTLKVDVVNNPTFSGTVTANGGLTVGANQTVNMGGNTITNVAAGISGTDAVNVDQLNGAIANVTTNVTNVTNLVGTNPTNPDGTTGLTTYDVAQQTKTTHTNLLDTVNRMNLQGIKYVHTHDNGEAPVLAGAQTNDSSAGAAGSSAVGVNAVVESQATNGLALGRQTRVSATNATAVGNEAVAAGASAVAIGNGAQALGERSISIGTGNQVHAARSGAIGDPTTIVASATDSYSIGNNNTVNTANTFVMGNNVNTSVGNSVYLGAGAAATGVATAQSAGTTAYNSAIIGGATYNYAGGTPAGVVTVGSVGGERRVQNVAAGLISATSTDAINGSQLYATHQAINALSVASGAGWNLQANGNTTSITPINPTLNVVDGSNTTVSLSGNQLQINVVDNPTFSGPVTANGGLSVANNLTVQPNTVVDMGGNRITNVAPGVNPTDAATVSQLNQASASVNALGNRVNINHDKAMGGVASAMATAGLPQAYLPGKSMIAMGGATYQGRTAVAVGLSTISDNGHWIIKGSLNSNSHGHVGATIGAGYQW